MADVDDQQMILCVCTSRKSSIAIGHPVELAEMQALGEFLSKLNATHSPLHLAAD